MEKDKNVLLKISATKHKILKLQSMEEDMGFLDYCKYILENKADDLINKSEKRVVLNNPNVWVGY